MQNIKVNTFQEMLVKISVLMANILTPLSWFLCFYLENNIIYFYAAIFNFLVSIVLSMVFFIIFSKKQTIIAYKKITNRIYGEILRKDITKIERNGIKTIIYFENTLGSNRLDIYCFREKHNSILMLLNK